MVASLMDNTMNTITACILGSHLLVDGLEGWLDPLLQQFELPSLQGTPQGSTIAHTALLAVGLRSQIFGSGHTLPFLLRVVLAPVLGFEYFLSKLVVKKRMFF
jgi:hypothetical protein